MGLNDSVGSSGTGLITSMETLRIQKWDFCLLFLLLFVRSGRLKFL